MARLVLLVCALLALPQVHPDRIVCHAVERMPRLGGSAWVSGALPKPQRQGVRAMAPLRSPPRCAGLGVGQAAMNAGWHDNLGLGHRERTKTLDWVNEKTRGGGGLSFDKILEQSASRINRHLDAASQPPAATQYRSREPDNKFDSIMDRCNQRFDKYLHNDSQLETADVKKELSKALDRLEEKEAFKEPSDDFDVIIERSRQRIDVAAQRVELRGKREQVKQLQKSLLKRKQDAEAYSAEVAKIDFALRDARILGGSRNRIQDLEDELRVAQVRLRGMEHMVNEVQEEAVAFLIGLRDTEAQLEALRIRNELVLERKRQMKKLQNLLFAMNMEQQVPAKKMDEAAVVSLLSDAMPGSPADQLQAVVSGMETLADVRQHLTLMQGELDCEEQVHSQFQEFLWQRVGLNKNKAAIAAAAMPVSGEVVMEDLEATVAWLEKNVLVSHERLLSAVELRPSILLTTIEDNLEPVLDFLTAKLQLDKRGVASVITACPALLEADAKRELAPRLEGAQKEPSISYTAQHRA